MVRPRPNTPTGRILALICATPGEETIESLAAHVFAPPRPVPFKSHAEIKARAKLLEAHTQESRMKTSRIVRRLAEAGYLASTGGPVLADWFVARMERDGIAEALRSVGPSYHPSLAAVASTGPLAFSGWHEGPGLLHAVLVERVALLPVSVAEVVGSKPDGRTARRWRDLLDWGVVLSPRARFPTAKALDLVATWIEPKEST